MKKVECVKLTNYIVRATHRPGGLIGGYLPILRLLEMADNLKKNKKGGKFTYNQVWCSTNIYWPDSFIFEIIGIGQ